MAFNSGTGVGALVADVGAFSFRLVGRLTSARLLIIIQGFAGDDIPRCYRPSIVGSIHSNATQTFFELGQPREDMRIDSCVDGSSGLISDWDVLEKLFGYAQQHFLKVEFSETPIVIAEKPYNTPKQRHRLCEMMFERNHVPAVFLVKDAVLACYACGKTTGIAVDIGARSNQLHYPPVLINLSGTVVTPVVDGWVEARNCLRSTVGGRAMDGFMLHLVKRRRGATPTPHFKLTRTLDPAAGLVIQPKTLFPLHPTYEALMNLELGRDIKETVCRVADAPLTETATRYNSIPTTPFELPDGTIIDMGIERFQVPELICTASIDIPTSDDLEVLGFGKETQVLPPLSSEKIPRIIFDCASRCEPDSQGSLLSNVVVSGGGSCFDGLPERLKTELERQVHPLNPGAKLKVIAAGTGERAICPWLGGSILGSLGSFHEMWFTKAEYDEFGAQLVDRKCP